MTQEVGLLGAFAPELDGKGQGMNGLLVPTDERTTEVYTLEIVLLGLQVRNLPNIVTVIMSKHYIVMRDNCTHLIA